MSALFVLMGVVGLVAAIGLVAIEVHEHRRRMRTWRVVRLRFGRDVTSDAVLHVLTRIAGLRRGTLVQLDVRSRGSEISHYLGTDQASLETLQGVFRAVLPGLRLEPVDRSDLPAGFRGGRSIRLGGRLKVLRQDEHEATSRGLLAALQPLGEREELLVRWTLRPGRAIRVPVEARDGSRVPSEDRRRLRDKNDGAVLNVRGLVAVRTGHPARAGHLVGRIAAVLRSRSTSAGAIRTFPRSASGIGRELSSRPWWSIGFDRYAAGELVGLLGWPIDAPRLPGVSVGTSPLLMPSAQIPSAGRVIGEATWPGSERAVAQPVIGALSHSLIAGPTGYGKSTLITNLVVQDMKAGRGVVVIDGKGDTVAALLERVPEHRTADVVVLDCAASGGLPGISLFGAGDPELAADVVLGVFSEIWKDSWGPLSERYLRAGLVAVAHDPDGTLADVPFVFSDAAYRRKLVGRIRDPLTRATLQAYEGMSAGERAQQLSAPLGKLGSLLGRPVVRTVLGQSAPKLDFRRVLREQQIVLISLSPTRVGAAASRVIGGIVVFALFQAVQGRSAVSERARRPFMVVIDEPKVLGDLPMPLDTLLEQARGLGVGVTIAPQSLVQLPQHLSRAILTNAATRIVFAQNADDARILARDLADVSPEDLQDLGRYEAVARIGLGPGSIAPPVTIRTRPAPQPTTRADVIRAQSERAYGRTLMEVDEALDARHRPASEGSAVGRKRRTS